MSDQLSPELRDALDQQFRIERADAALELLKNLRRTAVYKEVAPAAGFHHRDSKFWTVLGQVMERDVAKGAPLRCSLVVNKQQQMPGASYFAKARSLGYAIPATPRDEVAFWVQQLRDLGVEVPTWALVGQPSAA